MGYKLVPWKCWQEWELVYEELYSQDAEKISSGINKVKVWITRVQKVPPAIMTTFSILSLMHDFLEKDCYSWRLALSMCITRFVNSLADSFQKGIYARSISEIAKNIGMPAYLVSIRHEATHGETLPSRAFLLRSARNVLKLLKELYWEPQKAQLNSKQQLANAFRNLKQTYKLTKFIKKLISNFSQKDAASVLWSCFMEERKICVGYSPLKEQSEWAQVVDKLKALLPLIDIDILSESLKSVKGNFESAALSWARWALRRHINQDFVACMRLISSNLHAVVTPILLQDAADMRPEHEPAIKKFLEAIPASAYIQSEQIELEQSAKHEESASWSLSTHEFWSKCFVGELPWES